MTNDQPHTDSVANTAQQKYADTTVEEGGAVPEKAATDNTTAGENSMGAKVHRHLSLRPMVARDPHEEGRVATTLELFFDLVFVVASGDSAEHFHHQLAEGNTTSSVYKFLMVSFAIWWTWVNFSFFATSFDTDDWLYRVFTLIQMAGMLVANAGIPRIYDERSDVEHAVNVHSPFFVLALGYVIMRAALVIQWIRATMCRGNASRAAWVYIAGLIAIQACWMGLPFYPNYVQAPLFPVFVAVELIIPAIAEQVGRTPWHPHHVTERFNLFTIIQLGECISGAANAISGAVEDAEHRPRLIGLYVCAFIVNSGLWWIYFWAPHHEHISSYWRAFSYAYLHFFIFTAAGAFSTGVDSMVSEIQGKSHLRNWQTSLALTVPVAVFILATLFTVMLRYTDPIARGVMVAGALIMQLDALIPEAMILTTVCIVVIVGVLVWRKSLHERSHLGHESFAEVDDVSI